MSKALTEADKTALYDGVSISMLADMFGMDKRKVSKLIRPVQPSGKREGFPIYPIAEAARYLVAPVIDLNEYIKQLRPNDLPPLLQKEYWAAQRSRQLYEEQAGELWRTEAVRAVFVESFKKLRTGILLFIDQIEAATEFDGRQRQLLTEMADGLLLELHRALIENDADVEIDTRSDDEIFGPD